MILLGVSNAAMVIAAVMALGGLLLLCADKIAFLVRPLLANPLGSAAKQTPLPTSEQLPAIETFPPPRPAVTRRDDPRARRIDAFGDLYDLQNVLVQDCHANPEETAKLVQDAAQKLLPTKATNEPAEAK